MNFRSEIDSNQRQLDAHLLTTLHRKMRACPSKEQAVFARRERRQLAQSWLRDDSYLRSESQNRAAIINVISCIAVEEAVMRRTAKQTGLRLLVALGFSVQPALAYDRVPSAMSLPPFGYTQFCLQYPADCRPAPANKPFRVTGDRLKELDEVNAAVNRQIIPVQPTSNLDERWVVAPRAGSCADYAVTKRHELIRKGWPIDRLLLAEVRLASGEHHLVLVAKTTTWSFVLDNLRSDVPRLDFVLNDYSWVRIETPEHSNLWTRSLAALV